MSFQGMEVDEVRDLAQRMRESQQRLAAEQETLQGRMAAIPQIWRGGDAEAFRDRWDSQVAPVWRDALDLLQRTAQSAEEHAAEQDVASEPDSGAPDGGASGGDGTGGMGDIGFTSDEGAGDVPMDQDIQDAWQQMSAEDRRAVLQEMVDQEFERYGMKPVDITFFTEPPEDGMITYGSWTDGSGTLKLNEYVLDNPDLMLTTVHEVRHAAQHEFVDQTESFWDFLPWVDHDEDYDRIEEEHGISREEIESWRENFDDYKSTSNGDSFEEYQNQPVEVDAREREDEFAGDELTFEQLQEYQHDAGVDVSEEPA